MRPADAAFESLEEDQDSPDKDAEQVTTGELNALIDSWRERTGER